MSNRPLVLSLFKTDDPHELKKRRLRCQIVSRWACIAAIMFLIIGAVDIITRDMRQAMLTIAVALVMVLLAQREQTKAWIIDAAYPVETDSEAQME